MTILAMHASMYLLIMTMTCENYKQFQDHIMKCLDEMHGSCCNASEINKGFEYMLMTLHFLYTESAIPEISVWKAGTYYFV